MAIGCSLAGAASRLGSAAPLGGVSSSADSTAADASSGLSTLEFWLIIGFIAAAAVAIFMAYLYRWHAHGDHGAKDPLGLEYEVLASRTDATRRPGEKPPAEVDPWEESARRMTVEPDSGDGEG